MARGKGKSSAADDNAGRPHAPRIRNRKAFRDFEILQRVEAGLVLTGTEVKSLRAGQCHLEDSYARLSGGEVFVVGMDIAVYPQAVGALQHEPKRDRKCLLHKRQIAQLEKLTAAKGMTIVTLGVYFSNGFAKVELGAGRGKKQFDKRHDIKKRQIDRDVQRAMRQSR